MLLGASKGVIFSTMEQKQHLNNKDQQYDAHKGVGIHIQVNKNLKK